MEKVATWRLDLLPAAGKIMAFLLHVLTSVRCSRRAPRDERFGGATAEETSATCLAKARPFAVYDDEDAKSTDASGPEYDDVKSTDTSGPEHANDSSSDDSDTEATDVMPNSDLSSVESDSDSERSSARKWQKVRVQHGKTNQSRRVRRLKRQPIQWHQAHQSANQSSELQESSPIGAVVTALDAWMISKNDAHASEHSSMPSSADAECKNQKLDGLQDAMSKLAPHEVALMKALLDVKLASS